MKKKCALVIGGTGMLKNVSLWLANNQYEVLIVSRQRKKFESVKENALYPENLHPILVDYHDDQQLTKKLTSAFHTYGYPEIVVSWIHSTAPNALPTIIHLIESRGFSIPWYLFHIQGSATYLKKEKAPVPDTCRYRRIYLGFVIENGHSRWLSHDEISQGTITAIKSDQKETVIGTLEPWEMRP
ncbi:short-chain dehydrogenase [Oceanobacillus salinisoli]|uniref:short-chain dehydrogenase n=1 Tax=Oceanobacillus salinisoli TaxID=2678611 RepID=UPI0018CC5805|nr:short-chain dehydrogenase [Oceanobacillus salinisoli]